MEIYDDIEFDEQDLETLRKQYHQLLCDQVQMVRKLMVLQAEVRAWRDADLRHDLARHVMGDGNNDEVMLAMQATDQMRALEDER